MSSRIKIALLLGALFLLLVTPALAKKAPAPKKVPPPEYPTQKVKKVFVAPFSYTATYHSKGSTFIPKVIINRIEKEGTFTIVGKDELEPLELDQELTTSKLARMGRKVGADAVISASISAFQHNSNLTAGRQNHAEVSFCIDWIDARRSKKMVHHCYTATGRKAVKRKGSFEKASYGDRMVAGTTTTAVEKFIKDFSK